MRREQLFAAFFFVAFCFLLYQFYRILSDFLGPLSYAALLAFIFYPLLTRVRGLVGGREGLAAGLMTLGFARNLVVLRRCAIGLFAATVIKVFVRDMANVETPYRILSFLIVGLVLVAASYLYHRFAGRILSAIDEEGTQA